MNISLFLAIVSLTPLTLSAQSPAAGAGGGLAPPQATPAIAPATTPDAVRLAEVQFDGENLKDVVQALKMQAEGAGLDPKTDALNFVISPGLEAKCVPAMSLRNVSPTEVLSVVTTVLGLKMEPVMGDEGGRVVAWLIKAQQAGADPFGGGGSDSATVPPSPSTPPSPPGSGTATVSGGASGAATASGFIPSGNYSTRGGGFTVPTTVAIAGSPLTGIASTPAPVPAVRVFGIAPMLSVTAGNAEEKEERAEKFARLIDTLNRLSNDQGIKTDIAAYREMDIIVVKCADPAGLALIAEAIEAMKTNVEAAKAPGPLVPKAVGR